MRVTLTVQLDLVTGREPATEDINTLRFIIQDRLEHSLDPDVAVREDDPGYEGPYATNIAVVVSSP